MKPVCYRQARLNRLDRSKLPHCLICKNLEKPELESSQKCETHQTQTTYVHIYVNIPLYMFECDFVDLCFKLICTYIVYAKYSQIAADDVCWHLLPGSKWAPSERATVHTRKGEPTRKLYLVMNNVLME